MRSVISQWIQKAVSLQKRGELDEARNWYRRAVKLNPNHGPAMYCWGTLEIDSGRPDRAVRLIDRAIALDGGRASYFKSLGDAFLCEKSMSEAVACYQLAIRKDPHGLNAYSCLFRALMGMGRTDEAIVTLKRALAIKPDYMDAYILLGQTHLNRGKLEKAHSVFEQACRVQPEISDGYFYLAVVQQKRHEYSKALINYQKALSLNPDLSEAHINSGLIHTLKGNIEDAWASYENALKIKPELPEAMNNIGNLCMHQGRVREALSWYERTIKRCPKFKTALYNHANCLRKNGRYQQAIAGYQRLIHKFPAEARAYNGLGIVYKEIKKHQTAIVHFRKAISLNPDLIAAYHNLASTYHDINHYDAAMGCLNEILSVRPDFSAEIKKCMLIPHIYESKDEIDDIRDRMEKNIDLLTRTGETLKDPFKQVGVTNFLMALHGYNEKKIREKIAAFYMKVCPELKWVSPYLKSTKTENITIGMVSRYFHSCTIGNLFHGIIKNLSKDKFKLILFSVSWKDDAISRSMADAASLVVHLPENLASARNKIAGYSPDILFYPEIGMDPFAYFLAFSRLAPVQCKKGFPVTMGIPAIDYFISSKFTEPPNAQDNYSEKLVRLNSLGYFILKPPMPKHKLSLEQLGIPGNKKLYACLQSLFKLHPDFDVFIGKILKKDPNALLLLLDGEHKEWNETIINRLEKIDSEARKKVFFIPRQPRAAFISLFLLPDAVIDSIYFSGGHTSLECFAVGVPVVTWPSSQMAGRLTYGYYKRMGVMDCIAKDADEYANIAFRLAHDRSWRDDIGRRIKEKSRILFENMDDVIELESFFERAVASAYCTNNRGDNKNES